ncbi:MAG: alpha/beta hydrolase [Myxococcota bacterium]|nr:alpha/beta hydrolase [Myxococcota bacterium]
MTCQSAVGLGYPAGVCSGSQGRRFSVLRSLATLLVLTSVGCATGHPLMPTPNLYVRSGGYPESQVAAAARSSRLELLYVTDRAPETVDGALAYGARRSASAAYGSVTVEIGDEISWEDLVEVSGTKQRARNPKVHVRSITEHGRFPATPRPFTVEGGDTVEAPEVRAEQKRAEADFLEHLHRRLATVPDKEVLVYVHGFNNSFDFAARAQAEVWHFLGRRGVPVLYSWPAAHGGLFGYFIDRESGEFTIFHLKEFLRLLASSPEVERIHVLAHSRGTDVVTTALRELVIETRAAGRNPRESLRIANLVLAAPDLDLDVVRQRLMAEKFGPAIGQITIYTTQADKALGASQTLMSGTRFGRVEGADLGEREQQIFTEVTNVNIVEVEGVGGLIGHAYYRSSPAASSDLILILQGGNRPGEPARPLRHETLNFWTMPKDYPNPSRGSEPARSTGE